MESCSDSLLCYLEAEQQYANKQCKPFRGAQAMLREEMLARLETSTVRIKVPCKCTNSELA